MVDQKFDLEKALLNPGSVFKYPQDILEDDRLKDADKLKILQLWAHDIELLEIADQENMGGIEEGPSLLPRIHAALLKLKEKTNPVS